MECAPHTARPQPSTTDRLAELHQIPGRARGLTQIDRDERDRPCRPQPPVMLIVALSFSATFIMTWSYVMLSNETG